MSLIQKLDRPPEDAFCYRHFLYELAGAHHLRAKNGVAAGDNGRDADLNRRCRGGDAYDRGEASIAAEATPVLRIVRRVVLLLIESVIASSRFC